jgi:DNA-binding response OmpR family regulator
MSHDQANCPVCGSEIKDPESLLIDIDGGYIALGNRIATLTRGEMKTFSALWRKRPLVVSREALLSATAGVTGDDEREIKIIDVYITHIRKKLKPLGIGVRTAWGTGYRIEIMEAAYHD